MEFRANCVIDKVSLLQDSYLMRQSELVKGRHKQLPTLFLGSCLAQFLKTTSSSHLSEKKGKGRGGEDMRYIEGKERERDRQQRGERKRTGRVNTIP